VVEIERIADSCGYAMPLYDYAGERHLLDQWAGRKDDTALAAYRTHRNYRSLDGRHCCTEPECAGEAQQRGGAPSWKDTKKGSNHSTVPMICRL
jgi:hypothetical protein